jgi:DNA repair exonuclease SbcCD ATPase subunit
LARERASGERAEDAAVELKAIRERVVALEKRLREQPTPEAVAELQGEVEQLTRVLTELADGEQTSRQQPWPRDLNGQAADGNWGTDPEDLRGG